MYRKVFRADSKDDLQIRLPEEYLNKEVEVIAFELGEQETVQKRRKVDDAIAFFKSVSVDMSGFKFNRDEANERN